MGFVFSKGIQPYFWQCCGKGVCLDGYGVEGQAFSNVSFSCPGTLSTYSGEMDFVNGESSKGKELDFFSY